MSPRRSVERWTRQLVSVAGALGIVLCATAADPALAFHFVFDSPINGEVVNRVTGHGHVVRASSASAQAGNGLALTGDPGQGVELGIIGFSQPATIALWIKRSATPNTNLRGDEFPEYQQERDRGQGRLLSGSTVSPAQKLAGFLRIGPDKLEVWYGKGWSTLISRPIPAEVWTHIAVVFDATSHATGFLDGMRCETVPCIFDGAQSPMELVAAAYDRRYGFPFAGAVNDVRIYRGALVDEDVQQLARLRFPDSTQRN